jgi:hypothetical protein
MIKHIFITFLSLALFQGFLFAKSVRSPDIPDSNTLQSSVSDTYQDEDVLISFNRAYSEADKCYVTLTLKILANNKIIRLNYKLRYIEVLDNFGNNLQYDRIGNYPSDSLRPGDEELVRINFSIKPLENTKYLLLKIPSNSFGNINDFELKFEPVVTTEELDQRAEYKRWGEERERERLREENKRLFIESVVSPLVITICTICIIWLLISKRKIIKLFIRKRPHLIPAILAAVMLFGALGQWPDGYYQLLRFVTCCVSVYVAYTAYTWQKMWAVWLFGFIAVLFNPLAPIHFSRELWQYVDIICAVLFTVIAFILRKPAEKK